VLARCPGAGITLSPMVLDRDWDYYRFERALQWAEWRREDAEWWARRRRDNAEWWRRYDSNQRKFQRGMYFVWALLIANVAVLIALAYH